MNSHLELAAFAAVKNLQAAKLTVTTAESCTGGLIAAAITGVPGASQTFRYGWVTYCNEAKERELGLQPTLIEEHGVVSEPVVSAMAEGAMRKAGADIAVAVSGNAGPTAAEGEPPVGTVCLAIARRGAARPTHTETLFYPGVPRNELRNLVVAKALSLIATVAQADN
ncbi:MAG: CinA family protein [Akkermansia sp.]|nr:CinA family protein [Akkermansia sp.]